MHLFHSLHKKSYSEPILCIGKCNYDSNYGNSGQGILIGVGKGTLQGYFRGSQAMSGTFKGISVYSQRAFEGSMGASGCLRRISGKLKGVPGGPEAVQGVSKNIQGSYRGYQGVPGCLRDVEEGINGL